MGEVYQHPTCNWQFQRFCSMKNQEMWLMCVCVYIPNAPVQYVTWYCGIQQLRKVQYKAPHVSELKMPSTFSSLTINATINEKLDVLQGIGGVSWIKNYSSTHSLWTKSKLICAISDPHGCDRSDTTQYVSEEAAASISDFGQWTPLKCYWVSTQILDATFQSTLILTWCSSVIRSLGAVGKYHRNT